MLFVTIVEFHTLIHHVCVCLKEKYILFIFLSLPESEQLLEILSKCIENTKPPTVINTRLRLSIKEI